MISEAVVLHGALKSVHPQWEPGPPSEGEMVEGQEEREEAQEVASRETLAPSCARTGSQPFTYMKITWDVYVNASSQAKFLNQTFPGCLPAGLLYKRERNLLV